MDGKQVLLTAQDIQEVQFGKSFGGYKTDEVDVFLDRCAETVDALSRINAENEHKMQVLGQSIMDYRAQEDTIRNALMNAQRMSDTILEEARQKAEQIVSEAQEKAGHIHEAAESDVKAERAELKRVQEEVSAFKARLLSVYREHLTLIGVLADEETPESAKAETDTDGASDTAVPSSTEDAVTTDTADEAPQSAAVGETAPGIGLRFDLSQFSLDDE